jgi:hypothetical protein
MSAGLLMAPICGEYVILQRDGHTDYVSPCWNEPGHDGPHRIIMAPSPTEPLTRERSTGDEGRGMSEQCPTCGSTKRDRGEAYDEQHDIETALALTEGTGNPGLVEPCDDTWHAPTHERPTE